MMNTRTIQILKVLGAVGLGGFLYFMPKQSATEREKIANFEITEVSDVDKAAEKVLNGMNPMEGIMELRAMVEADSMNIEAQLYLARFSVQSGQMDKAVARYELITRLVPDSLDGWWELAQVQFESGNSEAAEPLFAKVLEIDHTVTNALFFRGKCLELMGDTSAALGMYEQFLPFAPDSTIYSGVVRIMNELKKD